MKDVIDLNGAKTFIYGYTTSSGIIKDISTPFIVNYERLPTIFGATVIIVKSNDYHDRTFRYYMDPKSDGERLFIRVDDEFKPIDII